MDLALPEYSSWIDRLERRIGESLVMFRARLFEDPPYMQTIDLDDIPLKKTKKRRKRTFGTAGRVAVFVIKIWLMFVAIGFSARRECLLMEYLAHMDVLIILFRVCDFTTFAFSGDRCLVYPNSGRALDIGRENDYATTD